ncbi:MAG: hypothetical protein RL266_333, partial [Bacteroidota bacterium]
MKILNRIIFAFILVAFTMAGSVTFIVWKYEDDLKQFVLDAVHSTIETDLYFNENVKLSFWSDFPLIAVEIEDIRIQDSFRTDTLLMAEKAFVQFNLIKLIRNEMTIEGIRISDGFVRLRRNANDEWNFKVWKAPETKDAEVNTQFNIEILTLESIQLDYDDRRVDLNIQFLSEKSKIKGRFTESDQRLALSLSGFMQRLTTTGADRIVDLPLNIATVLNINSSQNIYTIEMGNAILAGNEMVVDAEWRKLEGAMNMEMKVHAGNIDPASLLPHVWPQMPDNIKNLDLTGKADLIFSMSGPFKLNSGPKLEATIRLRDGSLKFRTIQVSDLNFETKLTMEDIKRSEVMTLKFESFELRTPVGEVKGEGTLTDLSDPYLKISTTGNSKLEELVAVTGLDSDLEANGPISWNIKFEGPLGHQFRTTLKELKQMNWSGSINLEKTSIKFDSGIPVLQNFEAEIAMRDGKTS